MIAIINELKAEVKNINAEIFKTSAGAPALPKAKRFADKDARIHSVMLSKDQFTDKIEFLKSLAINLKIK